MNKKVLNQVEKIIISVMVFLVLAAALFIFTSCKSDYRKALEVNTGSTSEKETADQSSENGIGTAAETETTSEPINPEAKQIIEVIAGSGGYRPRKIEAKAGIPTILIMKSEGAYGCERAFNIPDLNISEILPESGQTEFDLGTQLKGTKLLGVCSMGMYYFQIFFN